MTELNLERVSPHDETECAAGMTRLRRERDSARRWAIQYENDTRRLQDALDNERRLTALLTARLVARGIPLPNDPDITGAAV